MATMLGPQSTTLRRRASSPGPVLGMTKREAATRHHARTASWSARQRHSAYKYRRFFTIGALLGCVLLFSDQLKGAVRLLHLDWSSGSSAASTPANVNTAQAFTVKDGLLHLADEAGTQRTIHPILFLMQEAEAKWQAKLARQSKTLAQAVATYKRKYGRPPPLGFDKWWTFATDNQVILLDDYDQIYRDMLPLWGLPSEILRQRSLEMVTDTNNYYHQGSFTYHIVNGMIGKISGGGVMARADMQRPLLERIVQYLPDMNITTWSHDTPVMHIAGEKKAELEDLARALKTLPRDRWGDWGDLPEFVGWEAMCRPQSKYRKWVGGVDVSEPASTSFISDMYEANDFCLHPEIVRLHSTTNNYGLGPRCVNLWPLFSMCKTTLFSDITSTPLEQWEVKVENDQEWEQKSRNKILWRGSTTGASYNRGIAWRSAQRVRLNLLTNDRSETTRRVLTTASDNKTLTTYDETLDTLNRRYFDIKFAGHPVSCSEVDGTCERMKHHLPFTKQKMDQAEANLYKYVLDIDGNGWSGRFHRLMSTNSAVLKSTGFTEWWGDRIQPWLHYIPVKLDYSDLHSIASFFIGDETSSGHDGLGKKIGIAGKGWAEQHMRFEDMEAYTLRLYLEYARLMNRDEKDPTNMDFAL